MKSTKKSVKKIILALIILILTFAFFMLFFYSRPLESRIVEVRFIVGSNPGFDLNSSGLIFGKIPPGGSGVRELLLENKYNFPVKVKVFASKNLVDFVYAEPSFVIAPLNTTSFSVNVLVPDDAIMGNYSGELLFEFRRNKP